MKLWCWLFGHKMDDFALGENTGVTLYHCERCRYWWYVT